MLNKQKILGVGITAVSSQKILEYVAEVLRSPSTKLMIVTPNPEMLVYASKHAPFKSILNEAGIALQDGVGLQLAAKILGVSLKDRMTGVDFIEEVCKMSQMTHSSTHKKPMSIGFLGGRSGVAEKAAQCLQKKYPSFHISFAGETWPTTPKVEAMDMLFVALGVPKQEQWIYDNLPKINCKVAIGVGGAFDYYSKKVPRAPHLVRTLGFEWLFRLIVQPWRIKRQLSLFTFLCLVLKEKFSLT